MTISADLTLADVKMFDGTGLARDRSLFVIVDGGSLTLGENAIIFDFTTADSVPLMELICLGDGPAPYRSMLRILAIWTEPWHLPLYLK